VNANEGKNEDLAIYTNSMSLESWLTTDSETPFLLKCPQSAFQTSSIQIPPE
jgi:hypothetical protein